MKVIWAPWRMEYIVQDQEGERCIFCPGEDLGEDETRLILYVGPLSMVMMNRFPYTNGHLLVAPIRHVAELEPLSQDETLDLLVMVRRSIKVLRKVLSPEGFNVGVNLGKVAGAGVEDHLHFHVVPRWNGDTNYMSVLGEVRVIPEHIVKSYRELLPYFQEYKSGFGGER